MAPEAFVIGIDAAVSAARRGAVAGTFDGRTLAALEVLPPTAAAIGRLLADLPAGSRVLVCVDAPLGWPVSLAASLAAHVAGERITTAPDQLFRRDSDRWIKRNIDQQPLDVGADRIARTAHAALELLFELREYTHRAIPLAWVPAFTGVACIEVYPAATLRAHGLSPRGYKAATDAAAAAREQILDSLALRLSHPTMQAAVADDHVFDALLCAVTGRDFLLGRCAAPANEDLARREGWIWVKHL